MTTSEWKALIRMCNTSTSSYSGHYKGIPIEVSVNSVLTRVYVHCNHENIVPPMAFGKDDELPTLFRKVFRQLYNTWYAISIDNLPF